MAVRRIAAMCGLLLLAGIAGCGWRQTASAQARWTTGFWFWNGSDANVTAAAPVDVIFFLAGSIQHETMFGMNRWKAYGDLPEHLPPAKEYWIVFRFDGEGVPSMEVVPDLGEQISDFQKQAVRRGIRLAGVQLDIDSPTRALPEYAALLRGVKEKLPADLRLSITALLDWFRSGTAIGDVLEYVDVFVPQFYDVGDSFRYGAAPVSAPESGVDFARPGVSKASAPFAGMVAVKDASPLAKLRAAYQEIAKPESSAYDHATLQAALSAARAAGPHTAREQEEIQLIAAKIDLRGESLESAEKKLKEFLRSAKTSEYLSEARGWLGRVYYLSGDQASAGKIYLDELNRDGSNLSRETLLNSLRLTYGYDGGPKLLDELEKYFDTPEHAAFAIRLATNPRWDRNREMELAKPGRL